ncbi:MAG: hypothetical protein IPH04_09055 [Saprospirales bacterium]|nr:hypothetical protein [Saprospirales bacterium]
MKPFNKLPFLLLLAAAISSQAQDWPTHYLRTDVGGAWTRPGDFDNDGDPDILIQANDSIFWNENLSPGWTSHLIDPTFYNSSYGYVDVLDMDGDGDLDVYKCPVSSLGVDSLTWNENLGNGAQWEKHFIIKTSYYIGWLQSSYGDLDGDNDVDLVISEYDASSSAPYIGSKTCRMPNPGQNTIWLPSSIGTLPLAISTETSIWIS